MYPTCTLNINIQNFIEGLESMHVLILGVLLLMHSCTQLTQLRQSIHTCTLYMCSSTAIKTDVSECQGPSILRLTAELYSLVTTCVSYAAKDIYIQTQRLSQTYHILTAVSCTQKMATTSP